MLAVTHIVSERYARRRRRTARRTLRHLINHLGLRRVVRHGRVRIDAVPEQNMYVICVFARQTSSGRIEPHLVYAFARAQPE